MDAGPFVVIGLLVVALVVAAVRDVARGRRERRAPQPVSTRVGPRRLVLVRHGETEWSRLGKHTGRTDVPLTEEGRAQAVRTRALLEGWKFDAVLVSPLGRAQETLELLDRTEPVTVTDDLREWDYGDDEGRTTAEIREVRPGWTVWRDGPAGGESLLDVAGRVARLLLLAGRHEGDVLVVAHGHVLRVLAARWLELHPDAGRLLALDPATISVLGHEREQPVLSRWNVSG
ncbi:MAG: Phosphoglycerate mutase [Actinomycetia bacterium]|nr:Phosphoglycerate mutase [Actinomycetes bacterium]